MDDLFELEQNAQYSTLLNAFWARDIEFANEMLDKLVSGQDETVDALLPARDLDSASELLSQSVAWVRKNSQNYEDATATLAQDSSLAFFEPTRGSSLLISDGEKIRGTVWQVGERSLELRAYPTLSEPNFVEAILLQATRYTNGEHVQVEIQKPDQMADDQTCSWNQLHDSMYTEFDIDETGVIFATAHWWGFVLPEESNRWVVDFQKVLNSLDPSQ